MQKTPSRSKAATHPASGGAMRSISLSIVPG